MRGRIYWSSSLNLWSITIYTIIQRASTVRCRCNACSPGSGTVSAASLKAGILTATPMCRAMGSSTTRYIRVLWGAHEHRPEAIKPMPHWFDKPLRVQSMDRFRGGDRDLYEDAASIFMRYASGHSGIMRFFCETALRREGEREGGDGL